MSRLPLRPIDVTGMKIVGNNQDLHHDLLAFLDYIAARSVRRSPRDNTLSKSDLKELAKRMGLAWSAGVEERRSAQGWVELVDFTAYSMKLVSYDANQTFGNFFSMDPTYRENFVVGVEKNLREFHAMTGLQQEKAIQGVLAGLTVKQYNELFDWGPLSSLDRFGDWQRSTSTALHGTYGAARRLLLSILAQLEPGVWYATESLVAYLKREAPYFLIPKNVQPTSRSQPPGRYSGLYESMNSGQWGGKMINDRDPDAFERVEGRFIERFLDSLPLWLRYVEVALHPQRVGLYPVQGSLRAFRVSDRYRHIAEGSTPDPQVTVQPNFEVIVVSEVYPSEVTRVLSPLGEVTARSVGQAGPNVITLKLKRERVAAAVAENPALDAAAALAELSGRALAQNVVAELKEWSAQSDVFTLYEGFGLLESADPDDAIRKLAAVEISPSLRLVRKPQAVFSELEAQGYAPLKIEHAPQALAILPDGAVTLFATPARPLTPEAQALPVTIKREERVTLRFGNNREAFEAVKKALLELHVPLESDEKALALMYAQAYDALLEQAIEAIRDRFVVTVQG